MLPTFYKHLREKAAMISFAIHQKEDPEGYGLALRVYALCGPEPLLDVGYSPLEIDILGRRTGEEIGAGEQKARDILQKRLEQHFTRLPS